MNRDSAIFTAKELNLSSSPDNKKRFVYLSSAKPPPFLNEYITTKFEAEQYLFKECENLESYTLRPGFIWNKEHRSWSIPLMFGCEILHQANVNVGKFLPFHS